MVARARNETAQGVVPTGRGECDLVPVRISNRTWLGTSEGIISKPVNVTVSGAVGHYERVGIELEQPGRVQGITGVDRRPRNSTSPQLMGVTVGRTHSLIVRRVRRAHGLHP